MIRFLLGRAVLLVLGLGVASLLIFLALRVLPGDVAQVIGGTTATPEQVARIRESLGLNESPAAQYIAWVAGLLRGDLGTSLLTGVPIGDDLARRFEITLPLTLLALVIALAVALPLGTYSALRHDRPIGVAVGFGSQTLAAVPALWAGLLLILLFGRGVGLIGLLPTSGFPRSGWQDPLTALASLLLPALTIGLIEGAVLLRFVRSAALEALDQDYVRAGAARGLTRPQALARHGLPNVGLSIVSVSGLILAGLITGAVLIEALFNLPGVGRMLVDDVGSRDIAKVQSEVFFLTGIVLVIGALIDVAHRLIDPRQRERAVAA
ncbi:ABC transporter permease [Microbacterium sp. SORGH_AS_0862]|uniref:ABC transporter permease n=1 Tax=Microbacterium sp. SORGH_AS_0862 TaxID=3041789 RepID=UPI002791ACED|nr:ABC transporter permease [Microbacterium sp. SORGH_AS_0862]MDQ1205714.1 peptide/nickel transport system permease protein [Microbacterium sp. SORGH_AS_0862]